MYLQISTNNASFITFSVCEKGRWTCSQDVCAKTCEIIGYQHIKTFDGFQFTYQGAPCEYTLVEVTGTAVSFLFSS